MVDGGATQHEHRTRAQAQHEVRKAAGRSIAALLRAFNEIKGNEIFIEHSSFPIFEHWTQCSLSSLSLSVANPM
jgi:hypothetical protein